MHTRILGKSHESLTVLGHGTWGIGQNMWFGVDNDECQKALVTAIDGGIRFFDTALVYGDGHSETLVGKAIRETKVRDETFVATKIPARNMQWPAAPDSKLEDTFPPEYIVSQTEQSLRNLGLEVIHLQQFHVWQDHWLDSPLWPAVEGTLARLVQERKVLHWGVSVNDHDPRSAMNVLEQPWITSAQIIFNIFDQSPTDGFLQKAHQQNVGVLARVPLDEGGLTGLIDEETQFPTNDWRRRYFKDQRKQQVHTRAEKLKRFLGEEVRSLTELALRYCISFPQVTSVIPGMRRPVHVRENLHIANGKGLASEVLEELKEHRWDRNWYV